MRGVTVDGPGGYYKRSVKKRARVSRVAVRFYYVLRSKVTVKRQNLGHLGHLGLETSATRHMPSRRLCPRLVLLRGPRSQPYLYVRGLTLSRRLTLSESQRGLLRGEPRFANGPERTLFRRF